MKAKERCLLIQTGRAKRQLSLAAEELLAAFLGQPKKGDKEGKTRRRGLAIVLRRWARMDKIVLASVQSG